MTTYSEMQPTEIFTLDQFRLWTQSCVYVWKRGNEALYVGASTQGIRRLFYHPICGVITPYEPQDYFEFFSCNNPFLLEEKLIKELQPRYNKVYKDNANIKKYMHKLGLYEKHATSGAANNNGNASANQPTEEKM